MDACSRQDQCTAERRALWPDLAKFTRFWQMILRIYIVLGKTFRVFNKYLAWNFEIYFVIVKILNRLRQIGYAIEQIFCCCKWPKLSKPRGNLVPLQMSLKKRYLLKCLKFQKHEPSPLLPFLPKMIKKFWLQCAIFITLISISKQNI